MRKVLEACKNVLEDVAEELAQDEVAELTSMALDRKIAKVMHQLEEVLNVEEA
jgi:hypothetical protein